VGGLADLEHRLATLAMTEFGEVIRDAVQGKAGLDAHGIGEDEMDHAIRTIRCTLGVPPPRSA